MVVWLVSCQLWVSRVSSRCFWWDGHVHGVTRGVTRERVSECGGAMERALVCTLVGCRLETSVQMSCARTLPYVARVSVCTGGMVLVWVCSDGVP